MITKYGMQIKIYRAKSKENFYLDNVLKIHKAKAWIVFKMLLAGKPINYRIPAKNIGMITVRSSMESSQISPY